MLLAIKRGTGKGAGTRRLGGAFEVAGRFHQYFILHIIEGREFVQKMR